MSSVIMVEGGRGRPALSSIRRNLWVEEGSLLWSSSSSRLGRAVGGMQAVRTDINKWIESPSYVESAG